MAKDARIYARSCGVVYLVIFLTSIVSFGLAGSLVINGDAAATATKILASEQIWRAGYSAEIASMVCDVAVAWLLYVLLVPVDRNLALLSAFFRLAYVATYAPGIVANIMVLPLLKEHFQQAAMFAVRAHDPAFSISLIFFGANLALVGYLIARAPINVRWLAIALEISGACYIINSFAIYLAPALHGIIFPWILLPPFVGEVGLTFWLLFTRRFNGISVA